MNISGVNDILDLSIYGNKSTNLSTQELTKTNRTSTFESIFDSVLNQVNETNELTNAAEEEQIKFLLGESDNTHDLQVAQAKANVSLSYTVALRKGILDAYKEIMNLQF